MIPERASAAPYAPDRIYERASRRQRAQSRNFDLGRLVEIGFRLLGWIAVTLLATAGLFVVVFAAFGNFTTEGFFLQLANLADRYGTADAARRIAFQQDLRLVIGVAASAVMFFRQGSLARLFFDGGPDVN